ncbi:CBS domain-containing protein [Thecamonas trahens ATCC 50062]|uniref:CBS domain-containing protein n=1 Tax=Thecamonas trahens ATCC 50062 TaxID=461836 RepID=A0A0L0D6H8_THETB|nr:CBS domain-containing protein [Thecamonas trahens ATCC 50062]KNC47987.1 CBS domain-containing protein [Thecamonas trahens ATCC 50062]|eukprot:XP_013759004.1 CBS domain-containing protein [Thecamonas trahens ATCC 50062]
MSSTINPVYEYLHTLTVGDVNRDLTMVVADASDDINEVVTSMASHGITSLPVVKDGACVGHVDSLDIVSHIVAAAPSEAEMAADEADRIEMFRRAIRMLAVEHIMDASGRDPYVPLHKHQPITTALSLFALGIHRCPVVSEDGTVVSLLSQSDILAHLTGIASDDSINHLERGHLGQFAEQELAALGLDHTDNLVVVAESDSVWSALKRLQANNVTAVAVTDASGKLVADLSATTLRGLVFDSYPLLLDSIHNFLATHVKNPSPPVVCSASTSFGQACQDMASAHVHRLWCVDAAGTPVGVFSATDAMRTIANVAFTADP